MARAYVPDTDDVVWLEDPARQKESRCQRRGIGACESQNEGLVADCMGDARYWQ